MPSIQSSTDLRNHYNEISSYCHSYRKPVYITKNGRDDLADKSIETYEALAGRLELYNQLQEGMEDAAAGRTRPFSDALKEIRASRKR